MTPGDILILPACYAIGCLVSAWYLVRWRTGSDLRSMHSGTTGARNAGRVLGRGGFIVVALLDVLRGFLATFLAAALGWHGWGLTAAGLAAVAGHLWPVQLGFHGGKGISISVGIVIGLAPIRSTAHWTLVAMLLLLVLWAHRRDPRARIQERPPR